VTTLETEPGVRMMDAPDFPESYLSYADLAVALLNEIEVPKHHRIQIAVAD
jgi:putative NADH-flavin reductase